MGVTDSCPFWTAEFVVAFGVGEAEEVLVKRPNDEIRRLGSRNPPVLVGQRMYTIRLLDGGKKYKIKKSKKFIKNYI